MMGALFDPRDSLKIRIGRVAMTDDAIFEDVSKTIKNALQRVHDQNPDPRNISATAFEIALKQLI